MTLEQSLLKLIWLGLCGIALTPLLFFPWFSSPFITSKVLPFQALVELTLAAAAIAHILDISKARRTLHLRDFMPTSPLPAIIGTFIGYAFLSSGKGVSFARSLWGIEQRQDGLVLLLHFYAWFVTLLWFNRRENDTPPSKAHADKISLIGQTDERIHPQLARYLDLCYAISVLVGISVILHWVDIRYKAFNLIPEYFNKYHAQRGSGVFGNAEYVGPYLVFHFFYGIYRLGWIPRRREPAAGPDRAKSGGRTRALLWTALLLLGQLILVGGVVVGQARAILAGMIAGMIFGMVRLLTSSWISPSLKIAMAGTALLLVIAAGVAWTQRNSPAFQNYPLLRRLHQSDLQATISTRSMLWKSALQGLWDHPIFGWGRSNVHRPLEKYYNPKLVQYDYLATSQGEFFWYDRSHNALLDLLAELGIIGGILFLGAAAILAISWWKIVDLPASASIGGALIAYGTANVVAFDSFGSLFGLFLFLAWIACLIAPPGINNIMRAIKPSSAKRAKSTAKPIKYGFNVIAAILVIFATAALVFMNLNMAMASTRQAQAMNAFAWNHPGEAMQLYSEAFTYFSPYKGRGKLKCAMLLMDSALRSETRPVAKEMVDQILKLAHEAESEIPRDAIALSQLSALYYNLGLIVDRIYLEQAESLGLRALDLSPRRHGIMISLGKIYILRAQPERAAKLFKQMVDIYEPFSLAHWYYALALFDNNQGEMAKQEIRRALNLGFQIETNKEQRLVEGLFGKEGYAELLKGR